MEINIRRLISELMELGHIGYVDGVGTNRLAYSPEFFQGRDYVKKLMEEIGMNTRLDKVGNLYGTWNGTCSEGMPAIVVGSHIDTVPNGGMYDGALGVIAGLEVIRNLKESGYKNKYPIEIIAFNEEEGNVIGGTFGSKAVAGVDYEQSMIEPMQKHGITGKDFESCKLNPDKIKCYIEYHIEQGGILENENITIGAVDGIFGIERYVVTVNGTVNHAGSTPMHLRNDAMEKSCKLILSFMEKVRAQSKTMVCTVGVLKIENEAANVIPGKVTFIIELRDVNIETIHGIVNDFKQNWEDEGVSFARYISQEETVCDEELTEMIQTVAEDLGYSVKHMYSGAGHDLINMSFIAPSALIFIPSVGGISHHKDEFSNANDIEAGTKVLAELVKKIDGGNFLEN